MWEETVPFCSGPVGKQGRSGPREIQTFSWELEIYLPDLVVWDRMCGKVAITVLLFGNYVKSCVKTGCKSTTDELPLIDNRLQ